MTQIKKTPEEDEWIALRNLQGVDVRVAGWTRTSAPSGTAGRIGGLLLRSHG